MRGLVFLAGSNEQPENIGGGLRLRDDLPEPKPGPDEVLVRVSHCGVCGTDLHIMQGHFPVAESPGGLVLGHELTGRLVEDGSPVFVNPNGQCGLCIECQAGRVHFCRLTLGTGAVGLARDGGWAQLVSAPANQVHRLPAGLPLDVGILVEPISCVLHGLDKVCEIRQLDASDSVLILGAGIIGLLWACLLHQRGLRAIDISDVATDRRLAVERLQLTGVAPRQPSELPSNVYQIIVDCTGVPKALESAYNSLASGGTLCVFGCAPEGAKLGLPYFDLVRREVSVVFCRINPFTSDRAIALTERLHRDGYLDLDKLGVRLFALADYAKAFDTLNSRQVPKVAFRLD